jgi:hypothetical protein
MAYTSPPTFYTGAYLRSSQLNILSDDIAYLQGLHAMRSAAIPLPTAPDQTWHWRYMVVHRFNTLSFGYTITANDASATPNFAYNGTALSPDGGGDFSDSHTDDGGVHVYTVDLSGLSLTVGQHYIVEIQYDGGSGSTFTLDYIIEIDT